MESWSYVSGGKGLVSNETISSSDTFVGSKNALVGWDLKTQCSFGNNMLVSGQQAPENQGFGELGYQDLKGQQVPHDSIRNALSDKVAGGKIINPFMVTLNAYSTEDESTSKISGSVVDSASRGSSFIDLQLGRFGDPRDAQDSRISKGIVPSSESSTPPRRARVGVNAHTAYCQVYSCNRDLSSSKEYHKRHKVCEVHSKAAKVIVNGIEQRFCQQCSRFHLLAEFDDGKRSCRKRLAGHNERRRKPQVGIQSGRTGKLLQSYNDFASGRFHGTALTTTSFICQDILPNGLLHPEKHGTNDWCKRVKVEDGADFSPVSASPITNGRLHSKPFFTSNNFDKILPTFHENGAHTAKGSIFSENCNRYPHDLGEPNAGSRSLLQDTSLGNDDLTAFDAASAIQGLSGITDSGCALSLLSSQSQNSSSHSSGIPMVCHLVVPGSNNHYSMGQVTDKLLGHGSRASPSGASNKFSLSGMSSAEESLLGPILISDGSDAVNFDITDGVYQGSHFLNAKDCLSCENDTTIDLLQLSSQLQRVEHQKQSMQVKQETDAFSFSRIT